MKNLVVITLLFGSFFSQAQQWTQLNDMPWADAFEGAVTYNGQAYIMAGFDREMHIYDPSADSFTTTPANWYIDLPELPIIEIDGVIYVVGIREDPSDTSNRIQDLFYAYNIAAGTWEQKANIPFDGLFRSSVAFFEKGGVIYIMDANFGSFHSYDIASDSWTSLPLTYPNTVDVFNIVSMQLDGEVYVGLGLDTLADVSPEMYRYNDSDNSWTAISSIPGSMTPNQFVCTEYDGKSYCALGREQDSSGFFIVSDKIYVYDPEADSWTQEANGPYMADGPVVFALNDELYIGQGIVMFDVMDSLFKTPFNMLLSTQETAGLDQDNNLIFLHKERELRLSNGAFKEVTFYDTSGKQVIKNIVNQNAQQSITIEKSLPPGIYFVKVLTKDNTTLSTKIIFN